MAAVHVRLFAGLHDLVGKRDLVLEMRDGATIGDLRDQLGEEYPIVQPFLTTLVCAVDEEYVPSDHVLHDGDDVALIPPISGGADSDVRDHIRPARSEAARRCGPARRERRRRTVLRRRAKRESRALVRYLEYDAYEDGAEEDARGRRRGLREFPITGIGVLHRIGRLRDRRDEPARRRLVAAPHGGVRGVPLAVDRIKQTVPIWKKEVWDDGVGVDRGARARGAAPLS